MVRWFLLLLLLSSACGPVHMRVSPTLQPGKLAVQRSGGAVRFAEFAAENVKRGSTRRWMVSFWTERRAARQDYDFDFVHAATRVGVHCESRWGDNTLVIRSLTASSDHMRVDCFVGNQPILSIDRMTDLHHIGLAQITSPVLQVSSVHDIEEDVVPATFAFGYTFHLNGQLIGAVQLDNEPTVWMVPGLPAELRHDVAAAAAALILFEDISEPDH